MQWACCFTFYKKKTHITTHNFRIPGACIAPTSQVWASLMLILTAGNLKRVTFGWPLNNTAFISNLNFGHLVQKLQDKHAETVMCVRKYICIHKLSYIY
jgi:hypothetical protein